MAMMMRKEWRLNQSVPLRGSLTSRILAGRGLTDPDSINDFLQPSVNNLHSPFLLPDIETACSLIAASIKDRQLIVIHGDYDVDGITSTALLSRFFRRLDVPCQAIIPDRMTDGYGLSEAGVDSILRTGGKLLITVDCGIAAISEIARLTQAGVQVVVTDHHECRPQLPEAAAVINPKRPDSLYPFRELAGVGVTLKLMQALCSKLDLGDLWLADLELAALGTVADVVPLLDENRMIVSSGLALIKQNRQCGLTKLLELVNFADKEVTAQTLGFVLAPRINAAGRLGNADIALELLMTDDPATASTAANALLELNLRRQEIEGEIMAEAIIEIDSHFNFNSSDLIIVAHEGWHQGVIGIVAARLAEKYCRPAIVLSGEDGQYRGSSRTWGEYDILAAITAAADYTVKFGGHRKAAGLVVAAGQLDDFIRTINQYAAATLNIDQLRPALLADLEINPLELTMDNADALQQLAPFGEDNPQPLLICRGLQLTGIRLLGNGRHLKLQLSVPGMTAAVEGIGFGLGDADDLFAAGDTVDVLFSMEINKWNGRSSLQLVIRDLVHSASEDEFLDQPWIAESIYNRQNELVALMNHYQLPLSALRPSGDEYKSVYQYLKSRFGEQPVLIDLSLLARRIARSYRNDLNGFRLARILSVFCETNLISMQTLGPDLVRLTLLPASERVKLEDSPTYQRLQAEVEL